MGNSKDNVSVLIKTHASIFKVLACWHLYLY
jgi:hypothetical protein